MLDQPLPAERALYPLNETATGKPLNHPANLEAVYASPVNCSINRWNL
jgi:hypothetical protein